MPHRYSARLLLLRLAIAPKHVKYHRSAWGFNSNTASEMVIIASKIELDCTAIRDTQGLEVNEISAILNIC
nr:hypothetical protein [Nocardia amamiensis]